jgi:DNA invertase Pin-like site-specific DNA recombinase
MPAEVRDLFDMLADTVGEKPSESARDQKRREKGLPDVAIRRELARVYLKLQLKLWPQLVKSGLLPKLTDSVIARMAEFFQIQFLAADPGVFANASALPPGVTIGAGYLRYSDVGSNPLSLTQQLTNILDRAHRVECFIPWEYVFADAAVTGTIAARTGYQMAKTLIRRPESPVDKFFIDELGRASRDHIESLTLGRLIVASGKQMIGATDGFDSANPNWKPHLTIFGMMHEMFIDQLREKVKRGMRDAFDRGVNIHPPAVGYKLVPVVRDDGTPVFDDEGRPETERVIDPDVVRDLIEGATLFADGRLSRTRVGRLFNEKKVGGHQNWDSSRVTQMLRRETYRGYEFNEKTYQIKDPDTGGVTVKNRPKSEWKRREVPNLMIFPPDLAARIDARLDKTSRAFDPKKRGSGAPSRTEVYPKTLVRPVCGVCGKPLWLGRSGEYGSFSCLDGRVGKKGCMFKGYKAVRIVEDAVAGAVAERIFNDEFVGMVVDNANHFLATDPGPTEEDGNAATAEEIRKRQREIKKLTRKLAELDSSVDENAVLRQVKCLRQEMQNLRGQAKGSGKSRSVKLPTLKVEDVRPLLDDLRTTLKAEVSEAAPILAALTGPVVVTQEVVAGADKPEWIARFSINLAPVMLFLGRKRGCPTTGTWEFLSTRSWTTAETVEARLRAVPRHEELAAQAASLEAAGSSIQTIAHLLGVNWEIAKRAAEFGKTNTAVPAANASLPKQRPQRNHPKAAEIVRLRDVEKRSFLQIAKRFKMATSTATRVYYRSKGADATCGTLDRKALPREHARGLSVEKVEQIHQLLRAGRGVTEIARLVGCGASSVYRERRKQNPSE